MNKVCGWWLLALLMGVTSASSAAPIMPSGQGASPMPTLPPDTRCRISVSNPVVDYGLMSRWQLEDIGAGSVSPGTRSLTVNVVCPYSRTIALRVEGERRGAGLRYGEHGATRLRLLDAQLDGNTVELRTVTSAGVITENRGHRLALTAEQRVAPVIQGRLAEGKILVARLEVQPVMAAGHARVSSRQRNETMIKLVLAE